MQRWTPLALLAALSAGAAAQDEYTIKVYPCPRLAPAPKIDGDLSDACWAKAPLVSGFTFYNRPELVAVQTSFRAGYDERFLYFAVRCDEPNAKRLTATHAGRDAKGVFSGEAVELFLDPKHNHADYFQLGVNLAGSFYDARRQDVTWNCAAGVKTKKLADGWSLELAVPWGDLGVASPKPGRLVGFNVCRDRNVGGARQWSNWSQTMANFHDPKRFAHLVLSPTDKMLAALTAELRKGDRRGPIRIYGHQGRADKAYLAMARDALARLDGLLAKLAAEGRSEPMEAVRREVDVRLETARQLVAPFRKRIGSGKRLGAAEWSRMSVRLVGLGKRLNELLWEARLAALLKAI